MSGKGKNKPNPSSARLKSLPAPAAGARKECPRRLQGIGDDYDSEHPLWRLSLLDLDHHDGWSWGIQEAPLRKIVAFLTEMERLTWAQVRAQLTGGSRRGPKHKAIPVDHLCPVAQRRLRELQLDDFEEMFRFRLGNMERLWGMILDGVFYPVWWDQDHKVCPGKDRD